MRVSGSSTGLGASRQVGEGNKPASNPQLSAVQGSAPAPGDALSVSSTAHFIAVVKAKVSKLPDVRTDKVEALRARMDSDDYNPDAEAVADGLVREHMPPRRD